jgi:peptide/nickel transport system ATP-binding protein
MTVLSVRDLSVRYGSERRGLSAVDGVSFDLEAGATIGIVGESGCGKSTLARAIVGLAPLTRGTVQIDGEPIEPGRRGTRRTLARKVQMVFQNPDTALDPRMTVAQSLAEALTAHDRIRRSRLNDEVDRLLGLVSLEPRTASTFPGQLSGGQKQRVAIARALAVGPKVLIADEITSALDASVQGTVLNLIKELQVTLGLSVIFIGHNLAAVRFVSDRIGVMYLGKIVEIADTDELLRAPEHPYTTALVASVPTLDATSGPSEGKAVGEPPDPHAPPTGCSFHPRCPVGPVFLPDRTICVTADPNHFVADRRHRAACHFAGSHDVAEKSPPDAQP